MAFTLKHNVPLKYNLPQEGVPSKDNIKTIESLGIPKLKGGSIGALGGGFKTNAIALGKAILNSTGTDDRFLSKAPKITNDTINSYKF